MQHTTDFLPPNATRLHGYAQPCHRSKSSWLMVSFQFLTAEHMSCENTIGISIFGICNDMIHAHNISSVCNDQGVYPSKAPDPAIPSNMFKNCRPNLSTHLDPTMAQRDKPMPSWDALGPEVTPEHPAGAS